MHYADGKATGDGFALFGNEEEFTKALQLNKSMIGNRYVELFDCPQKEFEMVGRVGVMGFNWECSEWLCGYDGL